MYSELGIWTGQNKPTDLHVYNLVWKEGEDHNKIFLYPNHLFYSHWTKFLFLFFFWLLNVFSQNTRCLLWVGDAKLYNRIKFRAWFWSKQINGLLLWVNMPMRAIVNLWLKVIIQHIFGKCHAVHDFHSSVSLEQCSLSHLSAVQVLTVITDYQK